MADTHGADTTSPPREQSIAELMRELSDQTARLVRQEVDLAKAELTVKGKRAGQGAGLFGAAGLIGLYGSEHLRRARSWRWRRRWTAGWRR